MSNTLYKKKIKGNRWNFHKDIDFEILEDGYVRIQQQHDLILLTPQQAAAIANYFDKATSKNGKRKSLPKKDCSLPKKGMY